MLSHSIKIGDKKVSDDSDVFFLAEVGVNHNGDINLAYDLINIAADAGADGVKFQLFSTDELILKDVPKASYQELTTDALETQSDMLRKLELSPHDQFRLKKYCEEKGLVFLTTPFDYKSLNDLKDFDIEAIKIASTDTTNLAFVRKAATFNKPLLLSTGMTYGDEIRYILSKVSHINNKIVLMQCTSLYPTPIEQVNLNVIKTYINEFKGVVGFSDHTEGIGAAPYAVVAGARIIEKHFTLDKTLEGPDHKASLDPLELKECIKEIRKAQALLGSSIKYPTVGEIGNRESLQKCIVASRSISNSDRFNEETLTAKRTGGKGKSAIYIDDICGQTSGVSYEPNDIVR